MITQTSRYEVSKQAMKELLALAQNIKSSGSGELPFDKLGNAKEYFGEWKKSKILNINFKFISFSIFVGIITILKDSIDIKAFAMITALYFLSIWYYNYSTLKYNYIVEMLGDLSHIKDPIEREYYITGLLKTLWNTEKDYTFKFQTKKFTVLAILASLSVAPLFLFDPQIVVFKNFNLIKIGEIAVGFFGFLALILKFRDEPFSTKT